MIHFRALARNAASKRDNSGRDLVSLHLQIKDFVGGYKVGDNTKLRCHAETEG
jgi:hypothetical protein